MIKIAIAVCLILAAVPYICIMEAPKSEEEQRQEDEAQLEFLREWREKQKKIAELQDKLDEANGGRLKRLKDNE